MSTDAVHQSKRARRACQSCRARKARFEHRGLVKADRDHTLCFECYRAERERRRARQFAGVTPPRLPFDAERADLDAAPSISLPARKPVAADRLAHRRRMLDHLQATARATAP